MESSPIHKTNEGWKILLYNILAELIHVYFDQLYIQAKEYIKKNKKDINVDALFQNWTGDLQNSWNNRELKSQMELINKKVHNKIPLSTIIENCIISQLYIMSIIRTSPQTKIKKPKIIVEDFIQRCYWNVAKNVAWKYPSLFNSNETNFITRQKNHMMARKYIHDNIDYTIMELLIPSLQSINVIKKHHHHREKHKHKLQSHNDFVHRREHIKDDIKRLVLTEENLRLFDNQYKLNEQQKDNELKWKEFNEHKITQYQKEIISNDDNKNSKLDSNHNNDNNINNLENISNPEKLMILHNNSLKTQKESKEEKDINQDIVKLKRLQEEEKIQTKNNEIKIELVEEQQQEQEHEQKIDTTINNEEIKIIEEENKKESPIAVEKVNEIKENSPPIKPIVNEINNEINKNNFENEHSEYDQDNNSNSDNEESSDDSDNDKHESSSSASADDDSTVSDNFNEDKLISYLEKLNPKELKIIKKEIHTYPEEVQRILRRFPKH